MQYLLQYFLFYFSPYVQLTKIKSGYLCDVVISNCDYLFIDKPGAPGTPKCLEYTEDSITLTWTPPKNDGGNPIKGYVVEKREKGKKDWQK